MNFNHTKKFEDLEAIALFTDGSVNPQLKVGIGACLIISDSILKLSPSQIQKSEITQSLMIRKFEETSSTKLELQTVLWGLEVFKKMYNRKEVVNLCIFTDSQNIANLLERRTRLESKNYVSQRSNTRLKNSRLYQEFYQMFDELRFEVIKLAGHSKSSSHDTAHRIFSIVDREVRKKLKDWMRERNS